MDYVYICRDGDNEELRYSIRSVLKNAPEGRVWLVGGKPDWYNGNFLPVRAISNKFTNIQQAIFMAAKHEEISEEFVMMNDDFFIVKRIDRFETYSKGSLIDHEIMHSSAIGPNYYSKMLGKTSRALRRLKIKNPISYEVHMPMIMSKSIINSIQTQETLCLRSMYGNLADVDHIETDDVKIYGGPLFLDRSADTDRDFPYLSTEDSSFEKIKNILEDMFPEPSEYES